LEPKTIQIGIFFDFPFLILLKEKQISRSEEVRIETLPEPNKRNIDALGTDEAPKKVRKARWDVKEV
jgi:hypothetical protein